MIVRRMPNARVQRVEAYAADFVWNDHAVALRVGGTATGAVLRVWVLLPEDEPLKVGAAVWNVQPRELIVATGPEAEGVAWVGNPLYSAARDGDRCTVSARSVSFETGHLRRPVTWLPRLLEGLAAIIDHLRAGAPVDAALRTWAEDAPSSKVRARSLKLLMRRADGHEARRRPAIRALMDRHPAVRLVGALQAGVFGRSSLEALVHDPHLSLSDRIRALSFLSERFRDAGLWPQLVKVACESPDALADRAVRLLGDALARTADDEVVDALQAIARSGGPAADQARRFLRDGRRGALSVVESAAGAVSKLGSE